MIFVLLLISVYFFLEMSGLKCRFYENQFPDVDETVVVNVRQIADMGAYVVLSEYNNIG